MALCPGCGSDQHCSSLLPCVWLITPAIAQVTDFSTPAAVVPFTDQYTACQSSSLHGWIVTLDKHGINSFFKLTESNKQFPAVRNCCQQFCFLISPLSRFMVMERLEISGNLKQQQQRDFLPAWKYHGTYRVKNTICPSIILLVIKRSWKFPL